jgi:tRNA pseudouridine38-40 synthase
MAAASVIACAIFAVAWFPPVVQYFFCLSIVFLQPIIVQCHNMKVKFICEYNGKNYCGFQRLNKDRQEKSIQGELEAALTTFLKTPIEIVASGRTDAGVHARGQVCSFNILGSISHIPHKILCGVNALLPNDIVVKDLEFVDDDFHARYSAKQKTYLYRVYVSKFRSPLRDESYHCVYQMPDIEKMQHYAGENFTESVSIERRDDEIWFWVTGKGFKKRQVRMMVGQLLYGKPQSVPAKGLTLWSVEY